MIPSTAFAGKTVAVFGLGASGNATVRALLAGGATVAAWDDSAASRAASERQGLTLTDLAAADWSAFAALVLAPGVPLTHPEPHWTVGNAKAAGVEVIGDVELFARERERLCPDAPFIAITGTNGKSTTTALIAHILRATGRDVQLGGNIGRAILTLEPPDTARVHVIEMSSFQIDLTPTLKPSVGVLLNVTPDHLDRHGTIENYAAIKERLVAGARIAVVGMGDDFCRAVAHRLEQAGRIVRRVRSETPGAHEYGFADGKVCYDSRFDGLVEVVSLDGIASLRGRHNAENAVAAFAATWDLVEPALHPAAYASFPGLPHRMEEIGRAGRVLFVNDSKATNADSTDKALASFPRDVYWILGGKPKEGGIAALASYFPRITKAYLIGEASEAFAATLGGAAAHEFCDTMDNAVTAAARDAAASTGPEPVVLLSPACASYDQYKNFEERGDHFRRLVAALPGITLREKPA
jgi:UDP-N-acetylmuramoylalanine--D-glutamate ligase